MYYYHHHHHNRNLLYHFYYQNCTWFRSYVIIPQVFSAWTVLLPVRGTYFLFNGSSNGHSYHDSKWRNHSCPRRNLNTLPCLVLSLR